MYVNVTVGVKSLEVEMLESSRYKVITEPSANPAIIATGVDVIFTFVAVVFFVPGLRPALPDERDAFFIVSLR
ncbi:MAG: hypothetical protein EBR86_06830 [Planctomycetia bacterium]|nr:hypothetical protein [Planctomycetia bacterium]